MSRKMSRIGKPLVCAVVLAVGAAAAEASDCVTPRGEGRVSLDCRAVPLGQILRALAAVSPIDTKLIDSTAQATPIYVAAPDASVAQALQATLDAAGISFVLYGADGSDLKVFASASTSPSSAKAAAAPSRPVAEAQEFVSDDVPDIEDAMPVPETKEAAAPGFVPTPGKSDPFQGAGIPGLGNGNVAGMGANPATVDPLRAATDPAGPRAQGPAQTMEEILARSAPAGVPGAVAPPPTEGKQVYSTMEEILARTSPPKQ